MSPFARGGTREGPAGGPTGPRRGGCRAFPGMVQNRVQNEVREGVALPPPIPHHSRPLQGLPGPLRWGWVPQGSARAVAGCTGIALPGTHRYTHPVYPPRYPPDPPDMHTAADRDQHEHRGACTYDRFGTRVGEPRGVRTHTLNRHITG